jgi:hypothetical protein
MRLAENGGSGGICTRMKRLMKPLPYLSSHGTERLVPRVGLAPTTYELKVRCSTIELPGQNGGRCRICTHDRIAPMLRFKLSAINCSANLPKGLCRRRSHPQLGFLELAQDLLLIGKMVPSPGLAPRFRASQARVLSNWTMTAEIGATDGTCTRNPRLHKTLLY